jgi:broad-specificity NMP kinase
MPRAQVGELNLARSTVCGDTDVGRVRRVAVILVTGMSGAGKSTALAELARRGHRVVDTDEAVWTEDVPLAHELGTDRLWRADKMNALLAEHVLGTLFISGCVANQSMFYPRFDAVVLLSAPIDLLLARVTTRTTNSYGKAWPEREQIMGNMAAAEPLLRADATAEIDTRLPPEEVADELERIASAVNGRDL